MDDRKNVNTILTYTHLKIWYIYFLSCFFHQEPHDADYEGSKV